MMPVTAPANRGNGSGQIRFWIFAFFAATLPIIRLEAAK